MDKRFLTPIETTQAITENGRRVLSPPLSRTVVLSLLAGFYIAFGAELATVVTQDAAKHLGAGISRLLGGSVFSLGLMLVVICGAELFTGNSMLVKAGLQREISWGKIAENWTVVILGNLAGSLFFAWLIRRPATSPGRCWPATHRSLPLSPGVSSIRWPTCTSSRRGCCLKVSWGWALKALAG